MAEARRILLLGGTREAVELSQALAEHPGVRVITSLAGRTRNPAPLPGEVRTGGFGGAAGLTRYLEEQAIDLLVDATHPFAATMANNAAAACGRAKVPRLKLSRPAWQPVEGDTWIEVASPVAAAAALRDLATRVFLTTGRQDLAAFANLPEIWFLVRLIEPPEQPLPLARHEVILGRGPFGEADEDALLHARRIEALVTKNSGGALTYAKLAAARKRGLPVVMIGRPQSPEGEIVHDVEVAVAWIMAQTH